MKEKKKLSLAAQIFIALVLAVIAGLLMQKYANFAETYIKPFGTIFLNLLKFIVVPIVLFSIMCGIISMKDIKKVGSIGAKTVVYYVYDSICHYIRTYWGKYVQRSISEDCDNRSFL